MEEYIKIAEEETLIRFINNEFKKKGFEDARASTVKQFNMIDCAWDRKRVNVYVIVQKNKIIMRFIYPFKVESNAIPLLALFKATYDTKKAFTHLCMNIISGTIGFEYSYIEDSTSFDSSLFWNLFNTLGKESSRLFAHLSRLAAGKLTEKEKEYYSIVLKNTLKMIDGKEEENELFFGFWHMKDDFSDFLDESEE